MRHSPCNPFPDTYCVSVRLYIKADNAKDADETVGDFLSKINDST